MEIFLRNLSIFYLGPPKIDLSKMQRKQGWKTGPMGFTILPPSLLQASSCSRLFLSFSSFVCL